MNRHNDLHAYMFEQSIHTGVVMACFDAFCQTITKKTVVVVDNASIHRSEEFADRMPYWKKHGLIIKYLSPYSPELNLIEILWRRIKYTWLPFSAYARVSKTAILGPNSLTGFWIQDVKAVSLMPGGPALSGK